MTAQAAKRIGQTKALQATTFMVVALLVVTIFREAEGDFANGVLFFFAGLLNGFVIIALVLLFGLTYLFGGMAGKEIILQQQPLAKTSFKYTLLIALAIIVYITIVMAFTDRAQLSAIFRTGLLRLIKRVALYMLPFLMGWLWATDQMRKARVEKRI